MPKPLTNMDSQGVAAYLPADLAHRARTHAKATRRSLSSVVAEALDVYFQRLDLYAVIDRIAQEDAEQAVQIGEIDHEAVLQQLAVVAAEQAARQVAD